jgi:hypothetical protein
MDTAAPLSRRTAVSRTAHFAPPACIAIGAAGPKPTHRSDRWTWQMPGQAPDRSVAVPVGVRGQAPETPWRDLSPDATASHRRCWRCSAADHRRERQTRSIRDSKLSRHGSRARVLSSLLLLCCSVAVALLLLLWTFRVPYAAANRSGKTPKGRRTGMCAVRGRGRMPLPRIPAYSRTRSAQRGGREVRVCFLLVTFLCTSKEK